MAIRKYLVTAFATTIVMAGHALAAPIAINNFSFEGPSQTDFGYTTGVVTGWSVTGNGGVWRPGNNLPQGPTNGDQVGYSNGGSLTQTLSAVLTANSQYTLNVDLLNRTDGYPNFSSTIEILAGGHVLASSTIRGGTAGTTVLQTVSFLSGASDAYLGQNLGIALVSRGGQSDWDNVRLNLAPVPEPETYAMMIAGLGLLGFMARRKKQQA